MSFGGILLLDLYLGIISFTLIVAVLVAFVMFASLALSTGDVTIEINASDKKITVPTGGKLLSTLASKNLLGLCMWRWWHLC